MRPHCGSTDGYHLKLVETSLMIASWGSTQLESADGSWSRFSRYATCAKCKRRVSRGVAQRPPKKPKKPKKRARP